MTAYSLDQGWTKIAAAGSTVEIQNQSNLPVYIMASSSVPAPSDIGILLFTTSDYRTYNLTLDLYARAGAVGLATLVVMSGFALASGSSSTSGSTSTAGTANFSQSSNSGLIAAIAA